MSGYMQAVIILCFVQRVVMQNKEQQVELVVIIKPDVHARVIGHALVLFFCLGVATRKPAACRRSSPTRRFWRA